METKPHIIDRMENCEKYASLHPLFPKAFEFLKRKDLLDLPPGRYEIVPDKCWANVDEPMLKPLSEARVESHRKCIDIQAPLLVDETIGLMTLGERELALPFDVEKDYMLFDAETTPVKVKVGEFAIFFPPLAGHAPCGSEQAPIKQKKVIVKIVAQ